MAVLRADGTFEPKKERQIELDIGALRDDPEANVEWLDGGFKSTNDWRRQSQEKMPSIKDFSTPFQAPSMRRRISANSVVAENNMTKSVSNATEDVGLDGVAAKPSLRGIRTTDSSASLASLAGCRRNSLVRMPNRNSRRAIDGRSQRVLCRRASEGTDWQQFAPALREEVSAELSDLEDAEAEEKPAPKARPPRPSPSRSKFASAPPQCTGSDAERIEASEERGKAGVGNDAGAGEETPARGARGRRIIPRRASEGSYGGQALGQEARPARTRTRQVRRESCSSFGASSGEEEVKEQEVKDDSPAAGKPKPEGRARRPIAQVRRRVSDGAQWKHTIPGDDGKGEADKAGSPTKSERFKAVLEDTLGNAVEGSASVGGTWTPKASLRRASTKKECRGCSKAFSGFGDTCANCRKSGPVPKECPGCWNYFVGFGDRCEECSGK